MKKLLSVFILIAIMIIVASCVPAKNAPSIDYGKKYLLDEDENQYYVFKKDQTGYYECYKITPGFNYTLSGRVEFVWREASDGAIYLFETQVSYNDDHTEGKEIDLISAPIYFSEEFFAYFYGSGISVRYIKEDSELEKSIKK